MDGFLVQPKGQLKRLDHAVMVIRSLSLISSGSKCGRRKLQRGIVGNVKAPVVDKAGGPGGSDVTNGDGEQIVDFLPAGLVLLEPPVLVPIF